MPVSKENCWWLNPMMGLASHPVGVIIILVASCFRNWIKLFSSGGMGPQNMKCDFAKFIKDQKYILCPVEFRLQLMPFQAAHACLSYAPMKMIFGSLCDEPEMICRRLRLGRRILLPFPAAHRPFHLLTFITTFFLLLALSFLQSGNVIPMPVPSSYNDITEDRALRDFIGWVWYDKEVYVPRSWESNVTRVVLRFEATNYNTIVVRSLFLNIWKCVVPRNIHTSPHGNYFGWNPPSPLEFPVDLHISPLKLWVLRPPPPQNF